MLFLKEWVMKSELWGDSGEILETRGISTAFKKPLCLATCMSLEACAGMNPIWKQRVDWVGCDPKQSHPASSSHWSLRRALCVWAVQDSPKLGGRTEFGEGSRKESNALPVCLVERSYWQPRLSSLPLALIWAERQLVPLFREAGESQPLLRAP